MPGLCLAILVSPDPVSYLGLNEGFLTTISFKGASLFGGECVFGSLVNF